MNRQLQLVRVKENGPKTTCIYFDGIPTKERHHLAGKTLISAAKVLALGFRYLTVKIYDMAVEKSINCGNVSAIQLEMTLDNAHQLATIRTAIKEGLGEQKAAQTVRPENFCNGLFRAK